jgi:tetratricopeptide (TPR) repeat protein
MDERVKNEMRRRRKRGCFREDSMRIDFGLCIGRVIICIFVIGLVTGCTTSKNILGQLKFWGPKHEAERTIITEKETVAKHQVRPMAKGNPESHYLLGQHLQQRGKHREAIAEFTKTIKIDPMHAKAYNLMGISYDSLGDYNNATKCYEVALDISPISEYYNNLGYNLIMKGDYEGSIEVLTTATNLAPGNDKIRNNLALAYSNKGKHDSALGEIMKTSDPDGNSLALAEALLKTGKPLVASELVAQASKIDPVFEQKLSENDQHVMRVARALSEQEGPKVAAQDIAEPVANTHVVKRVDDATIKVVRKNSSAIKKARAQVSRPSNETAAIFPPDFMFNKRQVKLINNEAKEQKPRINQAPEAQFLRNLFLVRHASGRTPKEAVLHTLSF